MRNAIDNPKAGAVYETINKVTLKTCGIKEAIQKVAEDPVWRDRNKMPLSTDVPNIKLIDIVTNDPDGPFGAKEASEGSIVSTPPAVVSAIHDATGVWFKELPITPEKVVKALKEKQAPRAKK